MNALTRVLLSVCLLGTSACNFDASVALVDAGVTTVDAGIDATVADIDADTNTPIVVTAGAPATLDDDKESKTPAAAYNGSGICGVAWQDKRDMADEIYFHRVNSGNTTLAPARQITSNDATVSKEVAVTFAAGNWGLAWNDLRSGEEQIWFAGVVAAGAGAGSKLGNDIQVSTGAGKAIRPDIAWSGSEFGIAYQDERDNKEIYFLRTDASGNLQGSELRVTNDEANSESPRVIWTGSEYLVVWLDERTGAKQVYMSTISAAGAKLSGDIPLTTADGNKEHPRVTAAGGRAGIVWTDPRHTRKEIYFLAVNPTGVVEIQETRISINDSDATEPDIAWSNDTYGISWTDKRSGKEQIYLTILDDDGGTKLAEYPVTDDVAIAKESSIAASGANFCIAWTDERLRKKEIFTAMVSF